MGSSYPLLAKRKFGYGNIANLPSLLLSMLSEQLVFALPLLSKTHHVAQSCVTNLNHGFFGEECLMS